MDARRLTMEPWTDCGPLVADSQNFDENRIRIRIKVKSRIRIRIIANRRIRVWISIRVKSWIRIRSKVKIQEL
jgi:hypothetical protein